MGAFPVAAIELPDLVLALATLLAVASLLAVLTRALRLPLTVILVGLGFAAGEIARARGVDLPFAGAEFNEVVIFVFLPALVFEAALTLPARVFMKNLAPILALATWALAISAALVGLAIHLGLGVSLTAALLFGALISATDPVAVTATFRNLGVSRRLISLVEGESLLNDGIAIVLFQIFLVAALGTRELSVVEGIGDFLYVFLGGSALGGLLGLAVAEVAARLGKIHSTALTVAVAYGSFVLADEVFGFSGVMASVAAGLVLSGLSNTLIPRAEVQTWHQVWSTIAFTANGFLFILIGFTLEARLIAEYWDSILVGVAAVLVARPLGVFPVMPVVTRLARLPAVGMKNQLVLVWGGLRGGVALALALAIPEALPEQERFIAMTGGVVMATLVINATTIGWLVRRLGLDRPSRAARFVAAAAQHDGAHVAREELSSSHADDEVERQLLEVEGAAAQEISSLALSDQELFEALMRRGLAVERATIQDLTDHGLLPQWHARVILNTLDDQIDELSLGHLIERNLFDPRGLRWMVYRVARFIHIGRLTPERWIDVAYRDLSARHLGAHNAMAALDLFARLPGCEDAVVERARSHFAGWHEEARRNLESLTTEAPEFAARARESYAGDLGRAASERELGQLRRLGLVSTMAVDHATGAIARALRERQRARRGEIRVEFSDEEDYGG